MSLTSASDGMMLGNSTRLRLVEMVGFKCFRDTVTAGPLDEHFTAILGPNGCGKSVLVSVMGLHQQATCNIPQDFTHTCRARPLPLCLGATKGCCVRATLPPCCTVRRPVELLGRAEHRFVPLESASGRIYGSTAVCVHRPLLAPHPCLPACLSGPPFHAQVTLVISARTRQGSGATLRIERSLQRGQSVTRVSQSPGDPRWKAVSQQVTSPPCGLRHHLVSSSMG